MQVQTRAGRTATGSVTARAKEPTLKGFRA